MINIKKNEDRGIYDFGWLKTSYTFSFGNYYNPEFMGYRNLRVINEDQIDPNNGFEKHYHDNMEIITYVISGELEHEDSMGNKYKIPEGDIQVMSAGTGIMHSEKNSSLDVPVHLFQIWIIPNVRQAVPTYNQKSLLPSLNKETLIVSNDGRDNSLKINQDVNLYLIKLKEFESYNMEFIAQRSFWIQIIKGSLNINNTLVNSGDGIYGNDEKQLNFSSISDSEILLFDLN